MSSSIRATISQLIQLFSFQHRTAKMMFYNSAADKAFYKHLNGTRTGTAPAYKGPHDSLSSARARAEVKYHLFSTHATAQSTNGGTLPSDTTLVTRRRPASLPTSTAHVAEESLSKTLRPDDDSADMPVKREPSSSQGTEKATPVVALASPPTAPPVQPALDITPSVQINPPIQTIMAPPNPPAITVLTIGSLVVGCMVGLFIIVSVIFMCIRGLISRRKKKEKEAKEEEEKKEKEKKGITTGTGAKDGGSSDAHHMMHHGAGGIPTGASSGARTAAAATGSSAMSSGGGMTSMGGAGH
ncbi:hypothetical protein F4805DRAFT_289929 [Annulohypoxylon moriforme]|nr:hypothetical protein F4805DRAFT_289929 [Annulohypoxylon moriforme]